MNTKKNMYSHSVDHDAANKPSHININSDNAVICTTTFHWMNIRMMVNKELEIMFKGTVEA